MTNRAPLARQKAEHESKEKLVDRVIALLGQVAKSEEDKEDLKERLLAASNQKLLRLFEVSTTIRKDFGTLEKLADAVASAQGRAKDKPYVTKLAALSPARLLDLHRTTTRRAGKKTKAA
jgi:hypothetical protein